MVSLSVVSRKLPQIAEGTVSSIRRDVIAGSCRLSFRRSRLPQIVMVPEDGGFLRPIRGALPHPLDLAFLTHVSCDPPSLFFPGDPLLWADEPP